MRSHLLHLGLHLHVKSVYRSAALLVSCPRSPLMRGKKASARADSRQQHHLLAGHQKELRGAGALATSFGRPAPYMCCCGNLVCFGCAMSAIGRLPLPAVARSAKKHSLMYMQTAGVVEKMSINSPRLAVARVDDANNRCQGRASPNTAAGKLRALYRRDPVRLQQGGSFFFLWVKDCGGGGRSQLRRGPILFESLETGSAAHRTHMCLDFDVRAT